MHEMNVDHRHLEPGTIAAYLDARLDAKEVDSVRRHLETCDGCRAHVVEASGALELISATKRRRLLAPALAAAAVVGLLFVGGPMILSSDQEPVLRGPESSVSQPDDQIIAIVSPQAGAVVPFGEISLTWRTTVPEALYVITVTDAGGDALWTSETRDTLVMLPASVVLEPGSTYVWYVDALLPDGRSATTGLQRFQTAR